MCAGHCRQLRGGSVWKEIHSALCGDRDIGERCRDIGERCETLGRDARHRGEMPSEQVSFLLSLPTPVPSTPSLPISGPQIPFGPHPPLFRMLSVNHRVCNHGHPCPPWSQPSLISLPHKVHWVPPQAHAFSSP